jgi:hypothetical protein
MYLICIYHDSLANYDILFNRRNEPIRDVREAALKALEKMGGNKADQAVKVTKVLSVEIDQLKALSKH